MPGLGERDYCSTRSLWSPVIAGGLNVLRAIGSPAGLRKPAWRCHLDAIWLIPISYPRSTLGKEAMLERSASPVGRGTAVPC